MSFLEHSRFGIFSPAEIQLIQRIFSRLDDDGLLPAAKSDRETFCRYVLSIYQRGMCDEGQLEAFCRVAVKHKYPANCSAEPA